MNMTDTNSCYSGQATQQEGLGRLPSRRGWAGYPAGGVGQATQQGGLGRLPSRRGWAGYPAGGVVNHK